MTRLQDRVLCERSFRPLLPFFHHRLAVLLVYRPTNRHAIVKPPIWRHKSNGLPEFVIL
jgi:hypothetical protein